MRHLLLMTILTACGSVVRPVGRPKTVPPHCFTATVWKQTAAACFETEQACEAALKKAGEWAETVGLSDLSSCGRR